MKKFVWASVGVAVGSFIVLSKDPLNDAVNFLIAGSIPGTNIAIGFWSTMLLVMLLAIGIRKSVQNARHKMIVSEVEKAKQKKTAPRSEEASTIEFDRSQRSVIAARGSEAAL